MGTAGVFQLCCCSTILLQHLHHVLLLIIWETKETYLCTMERLQLVTHLYNRNKQFKFQVWESLNICDRSIYVNKKVVT